MHAILFVGIDGFRDSLAQLQTLQMRQLHRGEGIDKFDGTLSQQLEDGGGWWLFVVIFRLESPMQSHPKHDLALDAPSHNNLVDDDVVNVFHGQESRRTNNDGPPALLLLLLFRRGGGYLHSKWQNIHHRGKGGWWFRFGFLVAVAAFAGAATLEQWDRHQKCRNDDAHPHHIREEEKVFFILYEVWCSLTYCQAEGDSNEEQIQI